MVDEPPEPPSGDASEVPRPQRLLDNRWLLLAVSVLIPTVLYLAWGLWELIELPGW